MEKIPITFEHHGKTYSGYFGKVAGGGDSSTWHLYDDKNYYLGRLRISSFNHEWVFDESSPADRLSGLANYFGNFVSTSHP